VEADGECLVTDIHWSRFPPTVTLTYETRTTRVQRVYSCTCVISRIIKVSRPPRWGRGRRRENGALIFFFSSGRCVGAHRHIRLDPDWGPKYTREFTLRARCRVDRDNSVGPRNCRQPDAALPTTSGSRIRSCKHLPFAQSASEASTPRGVIKISRIFRCARVRKQQKTIVC